MPKVCAYAVVVALSFSPCIALAQSSMALSSSTAVPGGSFSLNLSLSSPGSSAVASLQWTFTYPSSITNLSIAAGPSLTGAGKSLSCAVTPSGFECIASGPNQNVIANGVVAIVSATVSGSAIASVSVSGALASAPNGTAISITATGGAVTPAVPVTISSLGCNPASLGPGASSTCTVTLSGPASASGASVSLAATGSITVAVNSLAIASGSSIGTFTATAGQFKSDQSATVTASLNGTTGSSTIALATLPLVSSLKCAAAGLTSNGSTTCTVTLSKAAPAGGAAVAILASVNNVLTMPASVVIAQNATAASFSVSVGSIASNQSITIIASLNGSVAITALSLTAPAKSSAVSQNPLITMSTAATQHIPIGSSSPPTAVIPTGLLCDHAFLAVGHRMKCEVDFDTPSPSGSIQIAIASSGGSLAVPATVEMRAGQRRVRFEIEADPAALQDTAVLEAHVGSVSVQHSIALLSSGAPNLVVPAQAAGTPRRPIALTVIAADAHGLDVRLAAEGLPRGATFDSNSGVLKWTPGENDFGVHEVVFTASNTLGASTTKTVKLYADSGLPVITKLENGAGSGAPAGCSPGSVATIRGRSLLADATAEYNAAGGSDNLSGTRVLVNGVPTSVLFASDSRVALLCPAAAPGMPLAISVETAAGRSNEVYASMRESAPGLFTTNGAGTGQALATQEGSLDLAAIPNARYAGTPALPDDMVTFRATGVDCNPQTVPRMSLNLGPYLVPVVAARPLAGHAGVCELLARLPSVAGDAIPVTLLLLQNDGQQVASNESTISVIARQ